MVDVGSALILGAAVLLIGFISDELSLKFGVPDILVMILLGILLGPVSGVIPHDLLERLAPYFAALTLAIILFESGVNFPLGKTISESPRAFFLATLNVVFSMTVSAFILSTILGWSLIEGALLGAILGGSSSAVVLSLVSKLSLGSKAKGIISLESIFTDALVVVVAVILMRVLSLPTASLSFGIFAREVIGSIVIGALVGATLALLHAKIMGRLEKKLYSDVFVLGVVVLVYGFSEQLGGNGAISAFIFGIVLGNFPHIVSIYRSKEPARKKGSEEYEFTSFKPSTKRFYAQISFLMRTYFFAFLGIVFYLPELSMLALGLSLTALLLAVRYLSILLGTWGMRVPLFDKLMMCLICGRGLAAAVLANIVVAYGLGIAGMIRDLTTQVIIYTLIISSLAPYISFKKR